MPRKVFLCVFTKQTQFDSIVHSLLSAPHVFLLTKVDHWPVPDDCSQLFPVLAPPLVQHVNRVTCTGETVHSWEEYDCKNTNVS